MPETKREYRYALYTFLRALPLLVIALAAFVVVWRRIFLHDVYFWIAAAVFVASVAGCFLLNAIRWGFRCPTCGTTIRDPIAYDQFWDRPIHFYCKCCDVIWETGMKVNCKGD